MAPEEPRDVIWMRPEHAATGRPAQRSRAEITAAAVTIADREGLDAVSMRRVATELGTGAASLYRYVDNREDLLDLMIDATGSEYVFAAPTGDWLADLLDIGEQARAIMRRHPWLPSLLITSRCSAPTACPARARPASARRAPRQPGRQAGSLRHPQHHDRTVRAERARWRLSPAAAQRRLPEPRLATGRYPQLADLLAPASPAQVSPSEVAAEPADHYRDILARILTGLLCA
jgi:AcrR family transcriptional regulator